MGKKNTINVYLGRDELMEEMMEKLDRLELMLNLMYEQRADLKLGESREALLAYATANPIEDDLLVTSIRDINEHAFTDPYPDAAADMDEEEAGDLLTLIRSRKGRNG